MKNCKNCIHKEVCKEYPNEGLPPETRLRLLEEKRCEFWEDETLPQAFSMMCSGADESNVIMEELANEVSELTDKHWNECRQIAHHANGVPINLPCEAGATVYVIIGKKIKGKKKPVPQIEKGAVDRFIIGGAGVLMAEICLDSGEWCTACGPGSYYLTLEEAQEALKEETEEQKK